MSNVVKILSAKMTWHPRFLEDPNACMPCSSNPSEPWHSCCPMPGCCLPQEARRRLPQRIFRGSITQPTDPLCTLRSLGYPRTTQHSIPAASRQPARRVNSQAPQKRGPRTIPFFCLLSSSSTYEISFFVASSPPSFSVLL